MGPDDEITDGSEEVVEAEVESPAEEVVEQEDSIHPAWSEMLEALPSSLHGIVTPYLKTRDKNYQDGINKVHSQYADYKPFVDNKIPTDRINYALQVAQAIEERPEDMIKALQDYTGMSKAEATEVVKNSEPGQVESEIPDELFQHPKFQEMEKMVQTVAQHLVTQKQTEQQQREDEQLEEELETLRKDKGDFDEEIVLALAMANPKASLADCVDAYNAKINSVKENVRRPAPKVLGQGGGSVDSQLTQEDLKNPKNRKAVIAQMLAAGSQT